MPASDPVQKQAVFEDYKSVIPAAPAAPPVADIAWPPTPPGLPPDDKDNPPALKILLRSFPSVLVAHVLSPATMKPISDYRTYLELKQDSGLIQTWLRQGLLFVVPRCFMWVS